MAAAEDGLDFVEKASTYMRTTPVAVLDENMRASVGVFTDIIRRLIRNGDRIAFDSGFVYRFT